MWYSYKAHEQDEADVRLQVCIADDDKVCYHQSSLYRVWETCPLHHDVGARYGVLCLPRLLLLCIPPLISFDPSQDFLQTGDAAFELASHQSSTPTTGGVVFLKNACSTVASRDIRTAYPPIAAHFPAFPVTQLPAWASSRCSRRY
jgi:hypothetical protein